LKGKILLSQFNGIDPENNKFSVIIKLYSLSLLALDSYSSASARRFKREGPGLIYRTFSWIMDRGLPWVLINLF